MKRLINKPDVEPVSVDYPFGSIQDQSMSTTGTPVDREVYGDFHQFFEKLMDYSQIVANGLPDNATNGYQLYNAFRKLTKPYKSYTALVRQTGTGAPVATVLGFNEIGNITYAYGGVGIYQLNLTGAFVTSKTFLLIGSGDVGLHEYLFSRINANTLQITTIQSGAPANNMLDDVAIEIRVYD